MKLENVLHQKIIKYIASYQSKSNQKELDWVQKYLGSNKTYHGISSADMKKLARDIAKEINDEKTLIDLLNSLYSQGKSFTEIALAGSILGYVPKLRKNLDPKYLDYWLNFTHGWAEDDVLCQSNFTAEEVLDNWTLWEEQLKKFVQDENINKRRASLVLLTKPLRNSADSRLKNLTFENVDMLKHEKEILITKAVSWALRALVKFHKDDVLKYLEANKDSLPRIAYREALSKALTGKKYVRKS